MGKLSGKLDVSQDQDRFIIEISSFSSSGIEAQLSGFANLDWRATVAQVAIDTDYDGAGFEAVVVDRPEEATDFVKGVYPMPKDQVGSRIAVQISDILGQSLVLVHDVNQQ